MAKRHFFVRVTEMENLKTGAKLTIASRFGRVVCIHLEDADGSRILTPNEAAFYIKMHQGGPLTN